jgi:ATP-dependent 26S proteasome regulatory subunit
MMSSPSAPITVPFASGFEHLEAELERIDLLIQAQVNRARRIHRQDEFQGLYISEQEVDELLNRPAGRPRWVCEAHTEHDSGFYEQAAQLAGQIAERARESSRRGVLLPLTELARCFALTRVDLDAILICLALDLDTRYERLYAYLQDDVTRKRPSVDLILSLLCSDFAEKIRERVRFAPESPLLAHHFVVISDEQSPSRSPLSYRTVQLDDRIASYLLRHDVVDARLADTVRPQRGGSDLLGLVLPAEIRPRILGLTEMARVTPRTLLYLQGPPGIGKSRLAEAFCREIGLQMITADIEPNASATPSDFRNWVRLALREAILRGSGIYFRGFDALEKDEQRTPRGILLDEIRKYERLVLVGGNTLWEPGSMPPGHLFVRLELPLPSYPERVRLWAEAANGSAPHEWIEEIAGKYRLSGGQIRDAASTALQLALARPPSDCRPTLADFQEASRLHSNRKLATLARRIRPQYTWDDIVLPADRMEQLREICATLRFRPIVYEDWGFDEHLSLGKGLNVLFAGPSGTGKTMAAEILAHQLGLELYKTDLSTIVSKYIGETEKNLSRIFAEAASSNAILFFDEADALFGKRSEIRDSHDRYANIEVNYLLQEMERYEGMAILATNLRKNMDEAFVRRMHFVVEFPFPSVDDRLRIWQAVLPPDTPRDPGLDFDFLASAFEMSGGSIRNIALGAAFLAAANGGRISMSHLIRATVREYQKMGKVLSGDEFGEYTELAGIG